jgi:type I restriction enzyme S subunit
LAKAFQGDLVEADPEDEPAEVLLGRILEEKEKLKAVKRLK